MVAVKMLLDMWRNLTSATTNWSFTGNAKGNLTKSASSSGGSGNGHHKHRYNRLRSSGAPKSHSHPANLGNLSGEQESLTSSSEESLAELEENKKGWRQEGGSGRVNKWMVKHSLSAGFPFSSCTSQTPPSPVNKTVHTGNTFPGQDESVEKVDQDQASSGTSWPAAKSQVVAQPSHNNDNINDTDNASDYDDQDDVDRLTCDVCDRAFPSLRRLVDHQRKKRHYGCLQCDSIFPSLAVLECHREQMCHYDYAINYEDAYEGDCGDGSDSFFETDDDENGLGFWSEDADDEERERLL